ncbi:uncharacterized protein UV8b_03404 [Ustilaginoidea virens]|uniref:Uncharacterized protein n=1 Tax=Ustilaginoidea virens TaxID=1159556 RepID=A0A063BUK3_USTVR|nr:uncharacterized protein UV8b_03404 [Ustilaginoidea virens]QUC19163.1 hypothetical protein UV8b_03404 [Ustilaginoidea virens]GAO18657.1 hypothetical protein UVI_02064250 [Ustilaginoidea virens]
MSEPALRRPAEWSPQKETILAWPGLEGSLKDHPERLARITSEISTIARATAHFQPVTLAVGQERYEEAEIEFDEVTTPFPIKLHKVQGTTLDSRVRDFGPTFVAKGSSGLVGVDWNFNGWGHKEATPTSTSFAKTLLRDLLIERLQASIVAEGGALETDGEGTLLVTESSLLNENRNGGRSRQDIEGELMRTLGVEKIIWIPGRRGIDVSDCHIDALARFARPGVVLLSKANEVKPTDWTVVYEEALEILSSATDAKGRPFELIEVEEPDEDLFETNSDDVFPVRSYVNYLLVNEGVILPQFGDPAHDAAAIRVAQSVFGEERRIYPVLIEQLPRLGAGIHSSGQEIPLSG